MLGEKKPSSSASKRVPGAIARSALARLRSAPSTTRTNATTPRYWSYEESKIERARAARRGSPAGGGIRSTIASSTSSTPSPVLAEMRRT